MLTCNTIKEETEGCPMKKVVENVKFIQDGTLVFGDLYLEDGFIERIDYKTPHYNSDIAIPGFVDLHTHGFAAHACDNIDSNNLKALALAYARCGVTSFCPTLHARPLKEYAKIIKVYRKVFLGNYHGANYEGVHLEGPYLNKEQCGAMNVHNVQEINILELEEFLSEFHNDIKIMTLAPELEHAEEAIQLLHLYGIEVSLGHTFASFQQTLQAFELGASQITHLGNKMPSIDHHKESMMDAIFSSNCKCEIIMDRVHMQKEMLRWVISLLGIERVIAVSNSSIYSGCNNKIIDPLTKKNGALYQDKTLVGSCCDLLNMFQYLYCDAQYDLLECMHMCSTNAAKILNNYAYEIGLGKKINLVILDHNANLKEVIINGRSAL